MTLFLTPEQRQLQASLARFVDQEYAPDRSAWRQFADMGLLAAPFTEADGGLGGGGGEIGVIAGEFGRGLVREPYLATVVLAGGLIGLGGSGALRAAVLPDLIAGTRRLAFAHHEAAARYTLAHVETRAEPAAGSVVLTGAKSLVLDGDSADQLVVSARTAGAAADPHGLDLFLVDAGQPGVAIRGYETNDGRRAAEVTLAGVVVGPDRQIGAAGAALPLIEAAVDRAIAWLAAEAAAIMQALCALTGEYLKTRRQFGVPIGSFQVLQHRLVDMHIETEQALSMALRATAAWSAAAAERAPVMAAAKVKIGRAGRFVAQQAVQLHGGIGMTAEYRAGAYVKRLTMIDALFGNADHHLRRFARLT